MTLSIIAAMNKNRVIGKNNQLPWHVPEDFKYFKDKTIKHAIVMGRKTYESVGVPLSNRNNIVLTRQKDFHPEGVTVFHSIDPIIEYKDSDEEVFVIGGSAIYGMLLPFVSKIYLTIIDKDCEGDTYFPKVDFENDFKITSKSEWHKSKNENIPYQFIEAIRAEK